MKFSKRNQTHRPARVQELDARRAFDRVRRDLDALDASELIPVTMDLSRTASYALAAEARIRAVADSIQDALPHFEMESIDALRDTALAAIYACSIVSDDGEVGELAAEAAAMRRSLLVQAGSLAERGLIDGDRVTQLPSGRSVQDTGVALVAIAALLREAWPQIEGKTPISAGELERAAAVGMILVRSQGDSVRAIADAELRARAFTLLVRRYQTLKRDVDYARFEQGDAGEVAPSIYRVNRPGRRRADPPAGGAHDETSVLTSAPPPPPAGAIPVAVAAASMPSAPAPATGSSAHSPA